MIKYWHTDLLFWRIFYRLKNLSRINKRTRASVLIDPSRFISLESRRLSHGVKRLCRLEYDMFLSDLHLAYRKSD